MKQTCPGNGIFDPSISACVSPSSLPSCPSKIVLILKKQCKFQKRMIRSFLFPQQQQVQQFPVPVQQLQVQQQFPVQQQLQVQQRLQVLQ